MINRKAFIVGIKSTSLSKKEIIFLKKYKPWGVILFSRNVSGFEQIKKLIKAIRFIFKYKNYPILIDQEGGRVNRLNKLIETSILTAELFGDLYKKNKKKFFNYYKIYINQISYLLNEIGANINTVPVLDVRRSKSSNVIGDRWTKQIDSRGWYKVHDWNPNTMRDLLGIEKANHHASI